MGAGGGIGEPRAPGWRLILGYASMIALSVAAFALIRGRGLHLVAPAPLSLPVDAATSALPAVPLTASTSSAEVLGRFLLALLCITLLARGLGKAFQWIRQPPVMGEIIGGILLGPSLFGRVAPDAAHFLLPASIIPLLGAWSQVGAILFMFLVGVELDPAGLRNRGHAALAISHAGIVVPFLLGALFAVFGYTTLSSSDVPFTSFALFMGVSMAVTAFPVLARILTDRNAHKSEIGTLALTCAAADDMTAWCLLAFVVSLVQARSSGGLRTAVLAVAFVALAVLVLRPVMHRLARRTEERRVLTQGMLGVVLAILLASAAATDAIGVHALIGAFVLGAMIPHESLLARELVRRFKDFVVVFFLPAYFAFTGLRTEIGLVNGAEQWMICGAIILLASLGKFGGVTIASRLSGVRWRDSAALGVLMNTRGLMELIVLNIGYDLKLISPTLFAMLVVMAIVTTLATTPIFDALARK